MGSLIVVVCESGDRLVGVGCGIVVSKSSDLSKVENVRLASSAVDKISYMVKTEYSPATHCVGNGARCEECASFA